MKHLQAWARVLKHDVLTLWFALKHPQTPWHARVCAAIVTAYALSPIDLIPDFIPVLGLLDDLILIPIGLWLLLKMLPDQVVSDSRQRAGAWLHQEQRKPRSLAGLIIVVSLWTLAAGLAYRSFLA